MKIAIKIILSCILAFSAMAFSESSLCIDEWDRESRDVIIFYMLCMAVMIYTFNFEFE